MPSPLLSCPDPVVGTIFGDMVTGSDHGRRYSIGELDGLPWRRLAQVCSNTTVPAHFRKVAERRLALRVERLALGEQIALARIAPRAVLADLVRLREGQVFEAVLGNPKTTFADLIDFLRDRELPPAALRHVGEHHHWGEPVEVRSMIVAHPSTPVHTALTVLATLPEKEVRRLLGEGPLPPVVAIQARRLHDGEEE